MMLKTVAFGLATILLVSAAPSKPIKEVKKVVEAVEKPIVPFRLAGADEDWQPPNVFTTLKIGTPAVSYTFQLDQYFDDLIIGGPRCTSLSCKGEKNNRKQYDPKGSSTAKDQGDQAKLRYGTAVTGEYYTDSVTVDGIINSDVGIAVLATASQKFYKIPSDGVFGLSFLGKTRGKKNLPSPVNSILKGAKQKLVNIWFSRAKNNAERYGTLTFGKINTDNCSATVQYSAVDNTEDFTFHVQKIRFGTFTAHRELTATIDPNSPKLGLPSTIYKDILRSAGNTNSDSVSCSRIKDVSLDVKIGGVYYSLKAEDYSVPSSPGSAACKLLIQDNGDEFDSPFILGEPFYRRYCVTFDVDNRQVGFSASK